MDLREQEYVVVIAQEKTLSKAAERLFVSQPALSKFLQRVEDRLGVPLFERKKRQLIPTYAGERYLETARSMLQLQQNLELELRQLQEADRGKLTVGITPARGHSVLPQVLPAFQERFPEFELRILEETVDTLERRLAEGSVDIAFFTMLESARIAQTKFSCEMISQEEIVLCTPKNRHYELLAVERPGRRYPWMDLKCLENETFLVLKKETRLGQLTAEIMKRYQLSVKTTEMTTIDTTLCLVAQDYGVAFASGFRIDTHETARKISVFSFGETPEVWDFVAAYPNGYTVTQPGRYLINLMASFQ